MQNTHKLKKVVIPIAGLGTRMLPATKAIPKEMLPIVDKPIIQYVVEEAVKAGFKEIIFVTNSSKSLVENHFDTSFELESALEKKLMRSALKEIRLISQLNVLIHNVIQGEAKGLGHAILCAKTIIGKEPFAVMLPDMVIDSSKNTNNLSIMKREFDKNGVSSILLGKAKKEDINKYGIVKAKRIPKEKFFQITEMVEKPSFSKAPSNLFAVGRYVLRNEIFDFLSKVKPDKSGEIQLTSAIDSYIKNENYLLGFNLNGRVFDCGEKLGLLIANIEFAKKDKNLRKYLSKYFKK